jgi:hypothetical protein
LGIYYYPTKKPALMEQFERWLDHARPVFESRLGTQLTDTLLREAPQRYETLLPELPYIGGDANPLTPTLIAAAWWLVVYRVLANHGKQVEDVGTLIRAFHDAKTAQLPPEERQKIGAHRFSETYLDQQRTLAVESQQRRYPGDWVYVFVEGDGEVFDYGIDYLECAIHKFYTVQGVPELTPWICKADFYTSEALALGLHRICTLADGCTRCDFRYKQGRNTDVHETLVKE